MNLKYQLAPTWNEEFELTTYILKRHEEKIDHPSTKRWVNKIENRITFQIKTRYYLELLMPETMRTL